MLAVFIHRYPCSTYHPPQHSVHPRGNQREGPDLLGPCHLTEGATELLVCSRSTLVLDFAKALNKLDPSLFNEGALLLLFAGALSTAWDLTDFDLVSGSVFGLVVSATGGLVVPAACFVLLSAVDDVRATVDEAT